MARQVNPVLQTDESALDLLKRSRKGGFFSGLGPLDDWISTHTSRKGLVGGEVVEIYGPTASGKTEALMRSVAFCVLPARIHEVAIGGGDSAAVLVDTCSSFSTVRFAEIVDGILRSRVGSIEDCDAIIDDVVRMCHTSTELLVSLQSIGALVDAYGVRMVAIDPISSFFFDERAHEKSAAVMQTREAIGRTVRYISKDLSITVVATKPSFFNKAATERHTPESQVIPAHREYMPSSWHNAVQYRIQMVPTTRSSSFVVALTLPRSGGASVCDISEIGMSFR